MPRRPSLLRRGPLRLRAPSPSRRTSSSRNIRRQQALRAARLREPISWPRRGAILPNPVPPPSLTTRQRTRRSSRSDPPAPWRAPWPARRSRIGADLARRARARTARPGPAPRDRRRRTAVRLRTSNMPSPRRSTRRRGPSADVQATAPATCSPECRRGTLWRRSCGSGWSESARRGRSRAPSRAHRRPPSRSRASRRGGSPSPSARSRSRRRSAAGWRASSRRMSADCASSSA